ncbi:MAG: ATP-dependent DNA helicase RecG [Bacteroidetes bacterium]|nr:ATP-dependent DNA helicase RecG [Bacteroidota bacterium]
MSNTLQTSLVYLKGVGQTRAALLAKELELYSYNDLLSYYPFRYIDKTEFTFIKDIPLKNSSVQLKGKLNSIQLIGSKSAQRLSARLDDGTGSIELIWFRAISWLQKTLIENQEYLVYGKPVLFNSKFNITHPDIDIVSAEEDALSGKLEPVYSIPDKLKTKNITSKVFAKITKHLTDAIVPADLPENIPTHLLQKYRLISRYQSCKWIHHPENFNQAEQATRRIKFEELFIDQMRILKTKTTRQLKGKGFVFDNIENYFKTFYATILPFELTNAQKKVIKEIRKDVLSGHQMNRLLQGDVGSGKTMVAFITLLMAIDNNYQTAFMAPTEILAQQHFKGLQKFCNQLGIPIALLTGNTKSAERKRIFKDLLSGELKIIIGTHALIEDKVQFAQLGIVVIDEQHRFGVEQRGKMWIKNETPPHILVMTATPIPRTLAMTVYGDLDVSIIDELPPGRKEIKTVHRNESKRLSVFGFMKEQITEGRQVYIVYPLIEESEKLDLNNLMQGVQAIEKAFPRPQYQISIVHGRMKQEDKDFEMQRFLKKETQIMVATTVIEVGVDVPNATVMIIENSERFGLAQLHQLRGRVGRGSNQSYCILMTGNKLSNEARLRIKTMLETNDGFKISEVDMHLRGHGEIDGTKQSGISNYKLANIFKDENVLQEARASAEELLNADPFLQAPEHSALKDYMNKEFRKAKFWGKVS